MANKFPVSIVVSAVDDATLKIMGINDAISKMTQPLKTVGDRLSFFGESLGLPKLKDRISAVSDAGKNLFKDFKDIGKFGLVLAGAGVGFFKLVEGSARAIDGINEAAEAAGVSTKFFQQYGFAASQSGVDIEKMEGLLVKFSKNAADALKGDAIGDTFQALGISVKDVTGKLKTTEQLLPEVANVLSKIESPLLRNKIAMQLFGKEGARMGVFLSKGSEGIKELMNQADALGLVIGGDAIKAADDFDNTFKQLMGTVDKTKNVVFSQFFKVFIDLMKELMGFINTNRAQMIAWAKEFAKGLPEKVQMLVTLFNGLFKVISIVVSVGSTLINIFGANFLAVTALVVVMGKLSISTALLGKEMFGLGKDVFLLIAKLAMLATGAVTPTLAFKALWVAITGPVGLVIASIAAVAGAAYLIYKNWEPIKTWFLDFFSMLGDKLTNFKDLFGAFFGKTPAFNANVSASGTPTGAPTGAATAASSINAAGVSRAENAIQIDFSNMPQGTRVKTQKAEADIDLLMGYQAQTL